MRLASGFSRANAAWLTAINSNKTTGMRRERFIWYLQFYPGFALLLVAFRWLPARWLCTLDSLLGGV